MVTLKIIVIEHLDVKYVRASILLPIVQNALPRHLLVLTALAAIMARWDSKNMTPRLQLLHEVAYELVLESIYPSDPPCWYNTSIEINIGTPYTLTEVSTSLRDDGDGTKGNIFKSQRRVSRVGFAKFTFEAGRI